MKLTQHMQITAGGPGSGRRPGFGQGRQPGSGRPFGVKSGIHKVLTDAGFKHKGAYSSFQPGTAKSTTQVYEHPDTKHQMRISNGDYWKHADSRGNAVHDSKGQAIGSGPSALREHLSGMRVAAGGPGSGRRPGFGSGVDYQKAARMAERLGGKAENATDAAKYSGGSHAKAAAANQAAAKAHRDAAAIAPNGRQFGEAGMTRGQHEQRAQMYEENVAFHMQRMK